jgi:hypothetical protein
LKSKYVETDRTRFAGLGSGGAKRRPPKKEAAGQGAGRVWWKSSTVDRISAAGNGGLEKIGRLCGVLTVSWPWTPMIAVSRVRKLSGAEWIVVARFGLRNYVALRSPIFFLLLVKQFDGRFAIYYDVGMGLMDSACDHRDFIGRESVIIKLQLTQLWQLR